MKFSEAVAALESVGIENARGEAFILFETFADVTRAELLISDVECESEELAAAIESRKTRFPLQYIIGNAYFYRENYKVTKDCLIPREDTEILVDYAVKNIPPGEVFLDLCTGSGCVAVSTLKNTENTRAVGIDISAATLAVAEENAAANGVSNRLILRRENVLEEKTDGEFFAILANPPYISEKAYENLQKEIYFEPKIALVGGNEKGTEFYEKIVENYKNSLKSGGFFAFEIGYDQGEELENIAITNGFIPSILKDFSGNQRVCVLRRK